MLVKGAKGVRYGMIMVNAFWEVYIEDIADMACKKHENIPSVGTTKVWNDVGKHEIPWIPYQWYTDVTCKYMSSRITRNSIPKLLYFRKKSQFTTSDASDQYLWRTAISVTPQKAHLHSVLAQDADCNDWWCTIILSFLIQTAYISKTENYVFWIW